MSRTRSQRSAREIASRDDEAALVAQLAENTARRDLGFIERALFAQHLLDSGFGSQAQVAGVVNATRFSVSMALSILRTAVDDLAEDEPGADTIQTTELISGIFYGYVVVDLPGPCRTWAATR